MNARTLAPKCYAVRFWFRVVGRGSKRDQPKRAGRCVAGYCLSREPPGPARSEKGTTDMGSNSQADERFEFEEFDIEEFRAQLCRFLQKCTDVVNVTEPARQARPFRAATTSIQVLRGQLSFGETHRLRIPVAMRGRIERFAEWVQHCWEYVFSAEAQAFRLTQEWSLAEVVQEHVLDLARDYGVRAFAFPHTVHGTPEFEAEQAKLQAANNLQEGTSGAASLLKLHHWCDDFEMMASDIRSRLTERGEVDSLCDTSPETELPFPWERKSQQIVEHLSEFWLCFEAAQREWQQLPNSSPGYRLWSEVLNASSTAINKVSPPHEWSDSARQRLKTQPEIARVRLLKLVPIVLNDESFPDLRECLTPLYADDVNRYTPVNDSPIDNEYLCKLYADVVRSGRKTSSQTKKPTWIPIPDHLKRRHDSRVVSVRLKLGSLLLSERWKSPPTTDLTQTIDGQDELVARAIIERGATNPEFRKLQDEADRLREESEQLKEVPSDEEQFLAQNGFDLSGDESKWLQSVARVIERDLDTIGPVELMQEAVAWIERERIRATFSGNSGRQSPDQIPNPPDVGDLVIPEGPRNESPAERQPDGRETNNAIGKSVADSIQEVTNSIQKAVADSNQKMTNAFVAIPNQFRDAYAKAFEAAQPLIDEEYAKYNKEMADLGLPPLERDDDITERALRLLMMAEIPDDKLDDLTPDEVEQIAKDFAKRHIRAAVDRERVKKRAEEIAASEHEAGNPQSETVSQQREASHPIVAEHDTQPVTEAAESSGSPDKKGGNSPKKGRKVKDVIKDAESHLMRNPWPGLKPLARLLSCSPSTLTKACRSSAMLAKHKSDYESRSKSVSSRTVGVNVDRSVEASEPVDLDDLTARLIEECRTDEERGRIHAMSRHEIAKLAGVAYTDADTGKSRKSLNQ